MPIGDVLNGELYFVAKDGTEWSTLGTVTDMEILEAPGNVPEAHITTILREPIEFSAALDTDTEELWRTLCRLVGIDRLLPYQEELLRQCMNKKEETHMKMSEKMALRLHLMMWGDMQKELGDCPTSSQRRKFKEEWCEENFPGTMIDSSCWLCEYVTWETGHHECTKCPVVWGSYNGPTCQCNLWPCCNVNYQHDPISKILALPARNPELQYIVDDFNRAGKVRGFHDGYMSCLTDVWNEAGCIGEKFKGAPDVYKDYVHIDAFNGMKEKLAKASGLSVNDPIVEHIEAIRTQAYNKDAKDVVGQLDAAFKRGLDEAMEKILKGEIQSDTTKKLEKQAFNRGYDHAKDVVLGYVDIDGLSKGNSFDTILNKYEEKIRKKASEETLKTYFVDHPQAKYWCEHDVDQAFRQYAKEKTDPIKKALSEASGKIKEAPVSEHIDAIKEKVEYEAYKKGCFEQSNADRMSLSFYSELPDATNHCIHEHAKAIYDKGAADARKTMEQKFQDLFKK